MSYLVVDGAGVDVDVDFLPLWCLLFACLAGAVLPAAGASAAVGAADFGMSAAIAAVAIPADNNAEAINLIMGSPAVGLTGDQRIRWKAWFHQR